MKLSNEEIIDVVRVSIANGNHDLHDQENIDSIIYRIRNNLRLMENMPIRKKYSMARFFDKYQESFWFFVMISVVLLISKMVIENYLYLK